MVSVLRRPLGRGKVGVRGVLRGDVGDAQLKWVCGGYKCEGAAVTPSGGMARDVWKGRFGR